MSMANQGVAICLIGTSQFIERQKAHEESSGWNGAQFVGRLASYKRLPRELDIEDLMAVASSMLPRRCRTPASSLQSLIVQNTRSVMESSLTTQQLVEALLI